MSTLKKIKSYEDLLNHLGGLEVVAENYCLSVRQVYRWRDGSIKIPRKYWVRMQKTLNCTRIELLELFKKLDG